MEQTLKEKEFEETVLDDIESKLGEIELVITELSAEENEEKIIENLEALLQEIGCKSKEFNMFTVGNDGARLVANKALLQRNLW